MPFDAVLHTSDEYLQHISYRSDPSNPDTDGEGLDDYEELLAGTEPQNIDTDKDCLNDSVEITQLYDALNPNPDGDNYNDYQEYTNGTDPYDYNMTIDEWITGFKSGVLQGDFIEDPSVPELLGQIVAGVAPKVGTIADVRDVIANVSQGHWIIAIMSAVGVVPTAGDLLKSSSKVADFIARNVDKTDEITELIVTLSKSFPDDFAKLIPNSSLDEIVQAFKSSNTMSRKTYDEIVALFQKAGKRLPTLADDFNITGKIPSGTKVWNGTNHRQRGIEIDKLLGNNLGANYKTYDKLDEATLVATSIKSIDPMCTTYRTAGGFRGVLNRYARDLLKGKDIVKYKGIDYEILGRQLQLAFPDVPLTEVQKEVLNQFVKDCKDQYGIDILITVVTN